MKIITVVEDSNGLMFNHRRCSQDRELRKKIEEISSGHILCMNPYSEGQFESLPANALVSEDFLDEAGEDDFCFVEDRELLHYKDRIGRFYLFHWNRAYPSDRKLDFIPSEQGMQLKYSEDFSGFSHDKITMEVWER